MGSSSPVNGICYINKNKYKLVNININKLMYL